MVFNDERTVSHLRFDSDLRITHKFLRRSGHMSDAQRCRILSVLIIASECKNEIFTIRNDLRLRIFRIHPVKLLSCCKIIISRIEDICPGAGGIGQKLDHLILTGLCRSHQTALVKK